MWIDQSSNYLHSIERPDIIMGMIVTSQLKFILVCSLFLGCHLYWAFPQLLSCWIHFMKIKNIFAFSITSEWLDDAGSEKSFLLEAKEPFILHCILSVPRLLMTWWHKEPRHRLSWYWPRYTRIFQFQFLCDTPKRHTRLGAPRRMSLNSKYDLCTSIVILCYNRLCYNTIHQYL